ncbi:P-type DNA transfer ATPase VirB11 [Candidatus Pantoea soli]|uniref:Type IV secretion system protein n=1 Tax=Candidatus Pantoea soli TaxID=3098669 RepID=A0A518XK30_9GAMM|nr:P-type DNA transfer ATPase VirB11 [Pantoea soli]QDY44476.1 P-type DNA transfer ATPase VirB11 [Pantoea soli]
MNVRNVSLNQYRDDLFGEFLSMPGLTEIAVNRPGQIFTKIRGGWQKHDFPITYGQCEAFSTALAKFHGDHVEDLKPGLSAMLETGERCQIVLPPACERETISITIRKPSKFLVPHQNYIDDGFYNRVTGKEEANSKDEELLKLYRDGLIPQFMEKAVEYGKTIVVAGETGSGKTTYMKMLVGFIPLHLRCTTMEDNNELRFEKLENYVHLFYPSESGDDKSAIVTPARLIRWNYRMNPDRILLAEIRGAEAWDFLKITDSGHEGSMTSIHNGSPHAAIQGIVERCYQHPECSNLPYSVLLRKVLNCIDIVVSIDVNGDVRRMGDIYFKPAHRDQFMRDFKNEMF